VHDPLTVAIWIVRPWPQRTSMLATSDPVRWRVLLHHDHHQPYCGAHGCTGNPFPWWKPRSWSRFWRLAGRDYYWPPLITIWHREPGGRDSGDVCKHTHRVFDKTARKWRYVPVNRWRFHVNHWKIQVHAAQEFRRWALTRCEWCHGPSRKDDPVNVSQSWDGEKSPWWRGERGLFHQDCTSVQNAHSLCFCEQPALNHAGYGKCRTCGKFRAWRQVPDEADRLLASLPEGSRIPAEIRPALGILWAERRERREAVPDE